MAESQLSASLLHILLQLLKALEHESDDRRTGVGPLEDLWVKDEDRDHRVSILTGRMKGGIVREPEVSPEPMHGDLHFGQDGLLSVESQRRKPRQRVDWEVPTDFEVC
jgi:hypothetical protein